MTPPNKGGDLLRRLRRRRIEAVRIRIVVTVISETELIEAIRNLK